MIGGPYAPPPAPPRFYAYVVVDVLAAPPVPVAVRLTRAAARDFVNEQTEPRRYRVRRAKVTLYPS